MFRNFKTGLTIISVSSLLLSATYFIKPDKAIAGKASETCDNARFEARDDRIFLLMDCKRKDGTISRGTGVPISEYVVNSDGSLKWRRLGFFHKSCTHIRAFYNNQYRSLEMKATCQRRQDMGGGTRRAMINLDEKISNQDGVLAVDYF